MQRNRKRAGLGEFMIHEADGGFVLAPLLATDRIYKPW